MIQKVILMTGAIFFLLLSGRVIGETSILTNIKSAGLVLGGTLTSALLAFSLRHMRELLKSVRRLFREEEKDYFGLVREMETLARVARRYGPKALEEEGNKVDNPFLRRGVELLVDGYDRHEIRSVMEKEYDLYVSRKESQVNVLNTLAKLAPVFGFVGTVLGLIEVLAHMGRPEEIGNGMAFALLTTFYGLLFANLLFLPLAKKLSERTKAEAMVLNIIVEGILEISERKNAVSVSHRLQSYLGMDRAARASAAAPVSRLPRRTVGFPPQKLTARR